MCEYTEYRCHHAVGLLHWSDFSRLEQESSEFYLWLRNHKNKIHDSHQKPSIGSWNNVSTTLVWIKSSHLTVLKVTDQDWLTVRNSAVSNVN